MPQIITDYKIIQKHKKTKEDNKKKKNDMSIFIKSKKSIKK